MPQILTHADIRNLLEKFGAAIKLDQIRVDAMPRTKFKSKYDDRLWREWRIGHISYIKKLLSSMDTIPAAMLTELAMVATTCEPKIVRHVALEQLAEAVGGSCAEEECATAERFFYWLIQVVRMHLEGSQRQRRSRGTGDSILGWLAVTDPLRIAQDPECGYGQPISSVEAAMRILNLAAEVAPLER
jgi:hypothetical protein